MGAGLGLGSPLKALAAAATALALFGCSQVPIKPAAAHMRADAPRAEGAIPAPVQVAPVLPPPKPTTRPETYSVVVNNVPARDLLFALARDAKLQIDIHPGITGSVTLNAIDQTLSQLLDRIAKQIDMRYEFSGPNLIVLRDTPFLRTYRVDYVSASRNVKMQSTASTQFAAGGAAAAATGQGTGSTATVDVVSDNKLWDSIVQNVKEILRETDKVIPKTAPATPAAAPAAPPAAPAAAPGAAAALPAAAPAQQPIEFIEQASVIANRESGVLFVRATSRQHEKIQEFLDQVLASSRRQVLIEVTIAEVQLNNQYQRGIDWSRLRSGSTGFQIEQSSVGTPAGIDTGAFIIGYAAGGLNFTSAIRLLESFGNVRVLSSPKVGVLNNQIALLRVTRDIVYFTITPSATPITVAGGSGDLSIEQAFTTTPVVAAEGFMMSVLPQISESDTVVLTVRPTIRRKVRDAPDPNPALRRVVPAISNLVPEFETREMDSILRIQSGQIAVLGGLMQDSVTNIEDTIPGVRDVPLLGQLTAQRRDTTQKTELVIFLRATVVRDASLQGDLQRFRELLPGEDFFRKPNPGREPPG